MVRAIEQLKAEGIYHSSATRLAEIEAEGALQYGRARPFNELVNESFKGLAKESVDEYGKLCPNCWAAPCVCAAEDTAVPKHVVRKVLPVMNGKEGSLDFHTVRILVRALRQTLTEISYVYKNRCGIHDGSRTIYSSGDCAPDMEGMEDLLLAYQLVGLDNGQVIDIKE
jgi:hypothetical protein